MYLGEPNGEPWAFPLTVFLDGDLAGGIRSTSVRVVDQPRRWRAPPERHALGGRYQYYGDFATALTFRISKLFWLFPPQKAREPDRNHSQVHYVTTSMGFESRFPDANIIDVGQQVSCVYKKIWYSSGFVDTSVSRRSHIEPQFVKL
jgi:hypothetical protein